MVKRVWSESAIQKRVAEGRGAGEGAAYKPWISVRDFSSSGRVVRIWGHKTHRAHELFSDVEKRLFLALEWSAEVEDIREQYPLLDRDETQRIALQLGIRHPYYPQTHVPTVMTVDFCITVRTPSGVVTRWLDAKRSEDAENARSIEKLEIVRAYAEARGIDHHLVFHSQIPDARVRNIEWIRAALPNENEVASDLRRLEELGNRMYDEISRTYLNTSPLNAWCAEFDCRHGVAAGTALRVARVLLWHRDITADLSRENLVEAPMSSFSVPRKVGRQPVRLTIVGAA